MVDETAPVRFYVDDDARLPKTVQSQLRLVLTETHDQVVGGYPQDWGQYRQQVGFVQGLLRAIEICKEAEAEFTGQ